MCAIAFSDFESVSCLLNAGADLGAMDDTGRTAEAVAREAGNTAILQLVQRAGTPAE